MSNVVSAGQALGNMQPDDPFSQFGVVTSDNKAAVDPEPIKTEQSTKSSTIINSDEVDTFLNNSTPDVPATEGEATDQPHYTLSEDDMIVDPRDQKAKPFKEILGGAYLKKEYDDLRYNLSKEREAVEQSREFVKQNLPFVEAVAKSTFGRTLANNLAAGVPEELAINSAYAAIGKTPPMSQQAPVATEEADPEPVMPPDFDSSDPQHTAIAHKHLMWEARQESKKVAANSPMLKEIESLRQMLTERDRRDAEAQAEAQRLSAESKRIQEHNKTLYIESLGKHAPFDFKTLNEDQQKQVLKKLDDTGNSLGLTDEYSRRNALTDRDMIALYSKAFEGKNPFASPKMPEHLAAPRKPPLQPGSATAGSLQNGRSPGLNESQRIQAQLEKMASGVQ